MKNFACILVLSMFFTSCSMLNDKKIETPTQTNTQNETEVPQVEIVDENVGENSIDENVQETATGESVLSQEVQENNAPSDQQAVKTETTAEISSQISSELKSETESEEALSELFNEIEELFELAEQSGGQ